MDRPDWNARTLLLAPFLVLALLLLAGAAWKALAPDPAPETRVERAERAEEKARETKEDYQKAAVVGGALAVYSGVQAWRYRRKEKAAAAEAAKAGRP